MNKKNLILLATVAFIIFTNLSLLKSSARTKIHGNTVFFAGIVFLNKNVSFTVKQHCISPGQPFGTPDGTQIDSFKHKKMFGITINAGRHGSGDTVKCVTRNLFDSKMSFYNNFTFDANHKKKNTRPSKLNFAVKGTLAINGKYFDNIILAQGHRVTRNNWWFGGSNCQKNLSKNSPAEEVICTARDGTRWCFARGKISSAKDIPNHISILPFLF